MRIIRDFEVCPSAYRGAVVALGNFDGVHRGHQAILSACIRQARVLRCKAAVMTFEPHPREFFAPGQAPMRLYPLSRKLQLFEDMGNIDAVFLARFNAALATTPAASFVEDILYRQLAVRHIITGYDFAFGKGRQGDTRYLKEQAARLGFGFTRLPPVMGENGKPVSSSTIRALLQEGKVGEAAWLLGRPYAIAGHVHRGDGRGKGLGFPTANVPLSGLFLPRFGIYAARIRIGRSGAWHDGVASLGVRPMFQVEEPLMEAHIFGSQRDLYGKTIEVALVEFLRQEQIFEGNAALVRQMEADCQLAQSVLRGREVAHA